jgi:type IV pilus assembly protein PilE
MAAAGRRAYINSRRVVGQWGQAIGEPAMSARKPLGFTLIELMTVVLIIAVLAAIAFPSYNRIMQRTRRAEAVTIINEQQLRLEKHRVDNASYATYAPVGTTSTAFYDITISGADADTYVLTATRKGAQLSDTTCGNLVRTFNQGTITQSPTSASCW